MTDIEKNEMNDLLDLIEMWGDDALEYLYSNRPDLLLKYGG